MSTVSGDFTLTTNLGEQGEQTHDLGATEGTIVPIPNEPGKAIATVPSAGFTEGDWPSSGRPWEGHWTPETHDLTFPDSSAVTHSDGSLKWFRMEVDIG